MPEALKPSVRVTLEMGDQPRPHRIEGGPLGRGIDTLAGSVLLPSDPRAKSGVYWGYTVRIASGLSAVFSECPYEVRSMALLPSSYCQEAGLCVWTAAHTLCYLCRARTEQLLREILCCTAKEGAHEWVTILLVHFVQSSSAVHKTKEQDRPKHVVSTFCGT